MRSPSTPAALILAPRGRDTQVARSMLAEIGIASVACDGIPALANRLDDDAAFVVLTDEAARGADLRRIAGWVAAQPSWSDLPFVVLTSRGGGPERNPAASRLSGVLGNVTFVERPFHPTTFVSVARTALRGRLRQYDARRRLDELSESEARLRTALTAGRLGTWELELDGLALEFRRYLPGVFRPAADGAVLLRRPARGAAPGGRAAARRRRAAEPGGGRGPDGRVPCAAPGRRGALGDPPGAPCAGGHRRRATAGRGRGGHHRAQGRRARAPPPGRDARGARGRADGGAGACACQVPGRGDAARAGRAAASPGAEDGDARPADRGRRARLQQPAGGGDRQSRAASPPRCQRRAGRRADRRLAHGRSAGCCADAAHAGLCAAAGARPRAGRSRCADPRHGEPARALRRRGGGAGLRDRGAAAPRARRRQPARARAAQSGRERTRRGAGGWHDHRQSRRVDRARGRRSAGGRLSPAGRQRHGNRDGRRDAPARRRSVLLDEGDRQGNRARPLDDRRSRRAVERRSLARQRARSRHRRRAPAARRGAGRQIRCRRCRRKNRPPQRR